MRPEGWRNEYWAVVGEKDAYEAGASAMLEGLKKDAIAENHDEDDYIDIVISGSTGLKKGWLVFIEEKRCY